MSESFLIPTSYYNNPYYQWGRKDPILPSVGTDDKNKIWFDKFGTSKNNLPTYNWSSGGSTLSANAEIADAIKNPQTFNTSWSMDNLYYNLWDANCNETGDYNDITKARFEPVTKSVYDPCPPGFCLPPNGAFTGFTSTGQDSYTSSEFNVSGNFDNGWHFRTVLKGESGSETIFFPASGYRNNGGGVLYTVGSYGFYWSSVPYSTYSGCCFRFYVGFFNYYVNPRAYGFAVRPVAEN